MHKRTWCVLLRLVAWVSIFSHLFSVGVSASSLEQQALSPQSLFSDSDQSHANGSYIPLTKEGMQTIRSVISSIKKKEYDKAVAIFIEYLDNNPDAMRVVQNAELENVILKGAIREKISLITAFLCLCPIHLKIGNYFNKAEIVEIRADDGTVLRGRYFRSPNKVRTYNPTVVIQPSWLMSIRTLRIHVQYLNTLGCNVLAIDKRHHGQSEGMFCGLHHTGGPDVDAVGRFIVSRRERYGVDLRYLIFYGVSLGGINALYGSRDEESPYTHLIVQSLPLDFEKGFLRGFDDLRLGLDQEKYKGVIMKYFRALLKANSAYFKNAPVVDSEVFPQTAEVVRDIKKPCLIIMEKNDLLYSSSQFKNEFIPLIKNMKNVTLSELKGGHRDGHIKDSFLWRKAIVDYFEGASIPYEDITVTDAGVIPHKMRKLFPFYFQLFIDPRFDPSFSLLRTIAGNDKDVAGFVDIAREYVQDSGVSRKDLRMYKKLLDMADIAELEKYISHGDTRENNKPEVIHRYERGYKYFIKRHGLQGLTFVDFLRSVCFLSGVQFDAGKIIMSVDKTKRKEFLEVVSMCYGKGNPKKSIARILRGKLFKYTYEPKEIIETSK
ncbi:MAG: alpha/beta hydrolase [Candidatus Ancaeobacter aquaticus]|nr:alpha/beta hydrolase [Candidatus Ancaeobacter aquaticus]